MLNAKSCSALGAIRKGRCLKDPPLAICDPHILQMNGVANDVPPLRLGL